MRWIVYVGLSVFAGGIVVLLFFAGDEGFSEAGRRVGGTGEFHGLASGEYFFLGGGAMRLIDIEGVEAWRIDVPSPSTMHANGGYALVYAPRGNAIYVFSTAGLKHRQTFSGDILRVSIGTGGDSAVIVNADTAQETHAFDPLGTHITLVRHKEPNTFPTSLAVSPAGDVALSLLDVSGIGLRSVVDIYREGYVFARLQYDDNEAILQLVYAGSYLIAFTDIAIHSFDIENNTRNTFLLSNRLSMVATAGESLAVVLGEGLPGAQSEASGTVLGFDAQLRQSWRLYEGPWVSRLGGSDMGFVAAVGRNVFGISPSGRKLWTMTATQDIVHISMLENTNTILFATNIEARVLRRERRF